MMQGLEAISINIFVFFPMQKSEAYKLLCNTRALSNLTGAVSYFILLSDNKQMQYLDRKFMHIIFYVLSYHSTPRGLGMKLKIL